MTMTHSSVDSSWLFDLGILGRHVMKSTATTRKGHRETALKHIVVVPLAKMIVTLGGRKTYQGERYGYFATRPCRNGTRYDFKSWTAAAPSFLSFHRQAHIFRWMIDLHAIILHGL